MPIISDQLSLNVVLDENQNIDTATAASFLTFSKNRLIVTKDSIGTISYAIMKIIGSYNYFSNSNNYALNSYSYIEPNFNGSIGFVDICDQPLSLYKIVNGERFKVSDSTTQVFEISNKNQIQPR